MDLRYRKLDNPEDKMSSTDNFEQKVTPVNNGLHQKSCDPDKQTQRFLQIGKFKFSFAILTTHLNIILYSACFWIQQGSLPYMAKKYNMDPIVFGYIQTTFAVVQLCGGPLFGRFGDLYGGRAAMCLAFVSSALTYGFLGLATSIQMMFVSRLFSLFMHAMQGGQMVVTDMSSKEGRSDALGKLGLSYGIGMVLGSLVGGIITKHISEQYAAFFASAGCVLCIFFSYIFIPVHTKSNAVVNKEEKKASAVFNVSQYLRLLKNAKTLNFLTIRIVAGIPIGVFQSIFSLVAIDKFKLSPDQNGYLMAYIGVISMAIQGIGIGYLSKRYTDSKMLKISSFCLIWSYLLLAYVLNITQLCLVLIPLCAGASLMTTVISSALTKTVSEADTGTMLGMNMAVNSLIRTMAPTLGGALYNYIGFSSIGYFGFATTCVVMLLLINRHSDNL